MFRGNGISNGIGLGGYVNGDVIRAGTVVLGHHPYVARLYLRYLVPLSEERTEPPEAAMGQLPSPEPTSRIEIKLGKLATTDDIDLNRYANNQRTQFLNFAFLYNTAWDYASDTRGYTRGISISLVKPSWRLTFGSYQEPKTANGYILDGQVYRARGDNLELTLKPNRFDTVIRLLAYRNTGRMGDYRESLDLARVTSTPRMSMEMSVLDAPSMVLASTWSNLWPTMGKQESLPERAGPMAIRQLGPTPRLTDNSAWEDR